MTTTASSQTSLQHVPIDEQPRFFGHPIGLYVLFFTEMWERFSYYGMRGLLRAYMVYHLASTFGARLYPTDSPAVPEGLPSDPYHVIGWDFLHHLPTWLISHASVNDFASSMYGGYTALVYATPFFGGIIADRWMGQRKAVYAGGLLMALGHFVMASEQFFLVALGLLILGNGLFKPNISTQVGDLYPPGDQRRDGAFTIFYMGINLGAFISNLICGTLAVTLGWHYGFGAAGVGLCIGLVMYHFGRKYLAPEKPMVEKKQEASTGGKLSRDDWMKVAALIMLCGLNIAFWAVYEQQGNTMQTWADTQTNWPVVFGFAIPPNWFQSFNPLMIFLMAPLLDIMWRWQAKRGKEPTSVGKMAMGATILGLSFLVMAVGAQVVGEGKGSLFWPFFCTLILTIGELYLSPIGLSLVTKVSPTRIVSMMMGLWLASSFFGNFLSGFIGTFYDDMSRTNFFMMLCAIGVTTGAAMWAFNKPLKKALGAH
ncbi:MAG: peptide MFS transporter [Myxococcales bacterium]|nr:peptide MFS transporter [Myxococcales bacterium]